MNVTSLTDKHGCINNSCINFCDDDNHNIGNFLASSSMPSSKDPSIGSTPTPTTVPVDSLKWELPLTAMGATKEQTTSTKPNNSIDDHLDEIDGIVNSLGMVMWKDFDRNDDSTARDTAGSDDHLSNKARSEAALAKEMATLSVEERNNILEDIHGVRTEFANEDPDYVDDCIMQLKQMLHDICRDGTSSSHAKGIEAYSKAMSSCPDYFDRKFYLMFLRSREFDIRETSMLFLAHFAFKSRLFGTEKLGRDITLDDLNEDDIAALHSGYHLFPADRDSAGRAVGTLSSKYATCNSWDDQV